MASIPAHLFAEDAAHEEFVTAILSRLAHEEGVSVNTKPVSARGGHGRALSELRLYQRAIADGVLEQPRLILVVIDANCKPWNQARNDIEQSIDECHSAFAVVGCPDPHIEKWYMADPPSFVQVIGAPAPRGPAKCVRDRYKQELRDAIKQAGLPTTLGGIEFATELVQAMDLYRAGRNEPSLQTFLRDCRAHLRTAAQA